MARKKLIPRIVDSHFYTPIPVCSLMIAIPNIMIVEHYYAWLFIFAVTYIED